MFDGDSDDFGRGGGGGGGGGGPDGGASGDGCDGACGAACGAACVAACGGAARGMGVVDMIGCSSSTSMAGVGGGGTAGRLLLVPLPDFFVDLP